MDAASHLVAGHHVPSFGLSCASYRLRAVGSDCGSDLEEETCSADHLVQARGHGHSLVDLGHQSGVQSHHRAGGLEGAPLARRVPGHQNHCVAGFFVHTEGFLVHSCPFCRGFRARIDGQEVRIHCRCHCRCVEDCAGAHGVGSDYGSDEGHQGHGHPSCHHAGCLVLAPGRHENLLVGHLGPGSWAGHAGSHHGVESVHGVRHLVGH